MAEYGRTSWVRLNVDGFRENLMKYKGTDIDRQIKESGWRR